MKHSIHMLFLVAVCVAFGSLKIYAQDSITLYNKIDRFPDKLFKKVNDKTTTINNNLIGQSDKYLRRMAREEKKLRKKLSVKDSAAAEKIFGNADTQYALLQQKIKDISGKTANLPTNYLPHLDSLQTALKFLKKTDGLLTKTGIENPELKEALDKLNLLQDKFSQAENIKLFMQQRRQFLIDCLGKYGLANDLKKIKKQVYYYQAQVEQYKNTFENPSKIESEALSVLQKTTLFKNFFKEHSQLASLFRIPESSSGNPLVSFAGLQTQDGVQQQLLQKFGALPDIQQMTTDQVGAPQSQLNELTNKVHKLLPGNGNSAMPDFKPNAQKTTSFLKRFEFGANLQTVKSNYFFPSTTDIALSVGYKINDKSTVGIGSSYKMGWGRDIRHVTISSQGIGLRSFVDFKIKGSFWLSGGAELNYRSQFKNFEILDDYTPWQKSALLGLSRKYQVSKKLKGNMQLMYDFLSKQQVPRTQPLVFRIGYSL